MRNVKIRAFSGRRVLLLSTLLFFFRGQRSNTLRLFKDPRRQKDGYLMFVLRMVKGANRTVSNGVSTYVNVTMVGVVNYFLRFLNRFHLAIFLRLFYDRVIRSPRRVLYDVLVTTTLVLASVDSTKIIFVRGNVNLYGDSTPTFFQGRLFNFLCDVLFNA